MIRAAEAALVFAALSAGPLASQELQATPPERTVTGLHFRGNRALDNYTLASAIATSASSWHYGWPVLRLLPIGTQRRLDELEFRRDVLRLQLLYRQRGYYEARIDTVVHRTATAADVTFRITEGPPVVVDSVIVAGLDDVGSDPPVRQLPLRAGAPFDRLLFDASADTLTLWLRNRGYPFAGVFRNYTVDRPGRTARVEFDAAPGARARVGEIRIEGEGVRPRTVRRSLAVAEGDQFSQDALFQSQRSLYQSDQFSYASVAVAPDSVVGGVDSLVRLRVQVVPAPPLRLRAGAGYGTIDCFRTSAVLTARNFAGEARTLDVTGRLSKIGVGDPLNFGLENSVCRELLRDSIGGGPDRLNYLASVTLTQPALLLGRATVSVSAFAERRSEFRAYRFRSVGASVGLRTGFGRHVPVSLTYRISRDETEAEAAIFCIYFNTCDPATLARFTAPVRDGRLSLSLVNTFVDSPVEPSRGYVLSFEGTAAAAPLGSEVDFQRAVAEAVRYLPLGRRSVLALRLRTGVIRTGRGAVGDSVRYVPPADRFYAGGPTTVRGFGRNEMGPVVYVADSARLEPSGDITYFGLRSSPVGSGAIVLGNLEVRWPAPLWSARLALAAYVDAGELWPLTSGSPVSGVTPGLGLQLSTPLGPMRLDAAYNGYGRQRGPLYLISGGQLVPGPSDFRPKSGATFTSRIQWHFSVGLAF